MSVLRSVTLNQPTIRDAVKPPARTKVPCTAGWAIRLAPKVIGRPDPKRCSRPPAGP